MNWIALRTTLAAAWCGVVLALGGVAAPAAFAVLDRTSAGRVAGQAFRIEAHAALGVLLLLFFIERRIARGRQDAGTPQSAMSAELLLVLGALFCTVLGYFALQPMMQAARLGQGAFGFGALHGASTVLFMAKGLLLAVLAWRSASQRL